MTTLYVKAAAALLLVAMLFSTGFHFGGLSSKRKLDELRAAQSEALTTALLEQKNSIQAETDRLRKVISTYEEASLTPADPGIAHRVYLYASNRCSLSKTSGNTGGTLPAITVTASTDRVEQALGAYIQACSRDALRLNALIEAWPR
jgi:hypothetical protein